MKRKGESSQGKDQGRGSLLIIMNAPYKVTVEH